MSCTVLAHEQGKRLLRSAQKQGDENGKKWTYERIAEKVHVEKKTVSRFFGGKERINFDTAKDICEVLGLDIEDIIDPNDLPLSVQEETEIDWHDVCQKVLVEQQQQQRIRRKITERGYELNIFVPLGLVERREQQRRSGEVSRDEVYQLKEEVITKKYQHDAFLQEVVDYNSSSQKNIAIIGEPGAGKSTLLDKIASWIQANDKGLSICVALGSLQGQTLTDYLLENWLEEALNYLDSEQRKDIDPVKDSLKELFRTQPVWLLLDGLDEMATSHNAVASIREQLQGWVGKARVILTSRLNVWDARVNNPLSNFDTYKTLDFTDEQVEEFIDNWFIEARKAIVELPTVALKDSLSDKAIEQDAKKADISSKSIISESPQLGTQLKAKVKESRYQHLQRLIKNPLRLSLLCQTWYHQQGDLPETKAGLYERFVREFYQEWKPEQYLLTWAKQQQLNQALGKLALRGIDSEARFRLPESLAYEVMGEELFLLACDIGWLNLIDRELATGEAIYAFYHPTFQEYFAATIIDDWDYFLPREHIDRPVTGKKYRIFESECKEVILFWFGREDINNSEKETFIEALISFKDACGDWNDTEWIDRGFYEYQSYFIAALGIAEFKTCSHTKEIIKQIIEWAFGQLNNNLASFSSQNLLIYTEPIQTILALEKFINSVPNKDAIVKIIEVLGLIGVGNERSITILEKLINTTTDDFTCIFAAKNLGKISDNKELALSTLIELSDTATNLISRILAAQSLGEIDPANKHAITILIKLFFNSSEYYYRWLAIEVLSKITCENSQKKIDFLKSLFFGDHYLNTPITNINNSKVSSSLNSILIQPCSQYLKIKAIEIIAKVAINNKHSIDALLNIVDNSHHSDYLRLEAVEALAKIAVANEKATMTLMNLISISSSKPILYTVLASLKRIAPLSLMPEIVKVIKTFSVN